MQTVGQVIDVFGIFFKVVSIKENGEVILEKVHKSERPRKNIQVKSADKSKYS